MHVDDAQRRIRMYFHQPVQRSFRNLGQKSFVALSDDGLRFEARRKIPGVRHTAVWTERNTLHLLYTLAGDAPERIHHATVDLSRDWNAWEPSSPEVVLEPELEWEGVDLPLAPSRYGRAKGRVRQLRDRCVFEASGRRYLLYSGAGESAIGLARIDSR